MSVTSSLHPSNMLIDVTSLDTLLNCSTIDYMTELIDSFRIVGNLNAKGAGCGCGISWELSSTAVFEYTMPVRIQSSFLSAHISGIILHGAYIL
jgi:hypothetical protein